MIIILNNKSNLNKNEFIEYQEELSKLNSPYDVVLCPTYTNLGLFNLNNILLGSQNVSNNNEGAFTGEISAKNLKSYNVKYSLVGHSERRKNQKETEKDINEKIKRLLENNITPILCVGETMEERENGEVKKIIKTQVQLALAGVSPSDIEKIIIAYEPIWSIGTGNIPKIEDILLTNNYIREILPYNKIIYGGSVNEENIDNIKSPEIDGYLLGGLSLKPKQLQTFIDKL